MAGNVKGHERIRILFVTAASRLGGAEKSLLDLLDCLDLSALEPLVALPGGGDLVAEVEKRKIPHLIFPFLRFRRTWNPMQLALFGASWKRLSGTLRNVMTQQGITLVHANGDMAQIYAGRAARAAGARLVWHVRDLTPLRWLRPRMALHADRIVAVSKAVLEMLVNAGVAPEKIRVVTNGLETSVFEAVPPPSPAPHTVGMIAHYYPWKGHKDFLHVAAEVVRELPDTRFVIAGEDLLGEQPGYQEELVRLCSNLKLENSIEFLGHCGDIPALMARLHLLAVPSHGEPFGRCVVEAMAAGRPVVSWNTGGPAEILADGTAGCLVPAYDLTHFARAVIELLKNPQRRAAMGAQARFLAVERFHRKRMALEVQAIYTEMMGS